MTTTREYWEAEMAKATKRFETAKSSSGMKSATRRMQECRMALRDETES